MRHATGNQAVSETAHPWNGPVSSCDAWVMPRVERGGSAVQQPEIVVEVTSGLSEHVALTERVGSNEQAQKVPKSTTKVPKACCAQPGPPNFNLATHLGRAGLQDCRSRLKNGKIMSKWGG